jgi:hypothetical protein
MIIDGHIHLLPRQCQRDRGPFCLSDEAFAALYSSAKAKLASEDDILAYLDRWGIDKGVVFGFPWASHDHVSLNNAEVWDFHARHPDRIVPFAVLPPSGESAAREAEDCLRSGFAGIGELAVYGAGWNAARLGSLAPILDLASAEAAPVLIHVNEPVGHAYPGKISVDFSALIQTIQARPRVNFILAHWGGGLFIYALMPEIAAIMARTYVDTAASPFLYSPQIYETACRVIGPERIIFGSDFPLLGYPRYAKELDQAGMEKTVRQAILGRNMEQLLESRRRSSFSGPLV